VTRHRDFKALVRERMTKTGERYAAARAQLLSQRDQIETTTYPGVIAGYDRFGGVQGGTAPLTNLLRQAGLRWAPGGGPFTETIVNGLCGGPGFLYAVFEYKGWPPMLSIALQARSMPDAYMAQGLSRVGAKVKTHETASPAPARKTLDGLLAEPRPALCLTGLRAVGVIGRDGGDYWIDDRSPKPGRMAADALARARAGYGPSKHRLWAIDAADARGNRRHREELHGAASPEVVLEQLWLRRTREVAGAAHRPQGQEGLADALRRGTARVQRAHAHVRVDRVPGRARRRTRLLRGLPRRSLRDPRAEVAEGRGRPLP
jgi:hypothetical protein